MDVVLFNDYLKNEIVFVKIVYFVENNDFGCLIFDDVKKSFGSKIVFMDIFEVK